MYERISNAEKIPGVKYQNTVLQIRRKTESSQSMDSQIDRILYLQRTIGNQDVGRLIKSGALQAKLRIGQPNDIYEQQADRVAEQVIRMPDISGRSRNTRIQRKCPTCIKGLKREKNDEKIQTKETPGQTPEITQQIETNINVLSGSGQLLPDSVRAFYEPRFNQDFSQVRIHTDTKAAGLAREVNALAFTVGKDVILGEGQFEPGTNEGRKLLAHELTHVIQQTSPYHTRHQSLVERKPLTIDSSGSSSTYYIARLTCPPVHDRRKCPVGQMCGPANRGHCVFPNIATGCICYESGPEPGPGGLASKFGAAATGALIGAGIGTVLGGIAGGIAGAGGGTLVAPGVGTVGLGAAGIVGGMEAGAWTGALIGTGIGGVIGWLTGE